MGELLRQGFDPENISIDKLRATNLRDFLQAQDQKLAPYFAHLANQSEQFTQVVADSVKGDTAMLTVTQGSAASKLSMTKVEGYWVPGDLAKDWEANIKSSKDKLAAKGSGEIFSGGLASVVASSLQVILAPLNGAKDAAQFHIAMESIAQSAQPLVTSLASVDTSRFRLGGSPPNQGYGMDGMGMEGMNDGYDPSVDGFVGMGMDGESPSGGPPSSGPPSSGPPSSGPPSSGPPRSGPPSGGPPSGGSRSGPPTNTSEAARAVADKVSGRSGS
jgi:hypothetical protein